MFRSFKNRVVVVSALSAVVSAAPARADDTEAVFTATGAGGLKFQGKTNEIRAVDEGDNLVVKVALRQLATGLALRDRHMKEKYLQVQQFPEAELKVARATLKVPADGEVSGEGTGRFSLHGKSKDLPFKYKAKRGKDGIAVEGSLHLNFGDFGVEVPSYLGVTVKPDVDVTAKFTVAK